MLTDGVSAYGTIFSVVIGFKETEPSDYVTDGSCLSEVFGFSRRFYRNNLMLKKLSYVIWKYIMIYLTLF